MCELNSLEMGLCHPYTHPLFPLRSKNQNLSQTYKTGSEEMLYAETGLVTKSKETFSNVDRHRLRASVIDMTSGVSVRNKISPAPSSQ